MSTTTIVIIAILIVAILAVALLAYRESQKQSGLNALIDIGTKLI